MVLYFCVFLINLGVVLMSWVFDKDWVVHKDFFRVRTLLVMKRENKFVGLGYEVIWCDVFW